MQDISFPAVLMKASEGYEVLTESRASPGVQYIMYFGITSAVIILTAGGKT